MSPSERSLFRRPAVLSRFPASAVIMVTAPESPRSHPDHDQELPVQQYLLILRENPAAFEHISPAEMQAIVERYVAWGHSLAERGVMAGGIFAFSWSLNEFVLVLLLGYPNIETLSLIHI